MTRSPASRFPTLTDQLYQLASGEVTSDELVRRSLHAIDLSQSTLNAFRVVLTESALADAAAADQRRAAGDQAPLLGVPIAVKEDVDIAARPTPADWANGRSPADPDSATPTIRGHVGTRRAGRRAVAQPRWPPAWSPPRSAPTERAVSASRPPGPIGWASNPR